MKRILTGLSAVLVVIGLAACAPVEGVVTDKTYKPDQSTWMWVSVPVYDPALKMNTIRQEYRYMPDPECYGVHVRTNEGKKKSRCVTAAFWESAEVGEYIVID